MTAARQRRDGLSRKGVTSGGRSPWPKEGGQEGRGPASSGGRGLVASLGKRRRLLTLDGDDVAALDRVEWRQAGVDGEVGDLPSVPARHHHCAGAATSFAAPKLGPCEARLCKGRSWGKRALPLSSG